MSAEESPSSPTDTSADLEEALVLIENLLRDAHNIGGGIVAAGHGSVGADAIRFLIKHKRVRVFHYRDQRGRTVTAEFRAPDPKAPS